MKVGDYIKTPRFCTVVIKEIFDNEKDARANGYYEPTHYDNPEYDILGKHTGENRMIFAAIKIGLLPASKTTRTQSPSTTYEAV